MNYHNLLLILGCSASIHAMHRTVSNESILELQRLLRFNRASNCYVRHRVSYNEWARRQEGGEREISNNEVRPLLAVLGFSALPTRTSEVDRRVQEIVSSPLFCDQIYKDQQAQETIRALVRDTINAGEILKGAITNRPRVVPVMNNESLVFTPLSSLVSVLVKYVANNVPDISSDDITHVQELVNQLLRQAERAEPGAKEMRAQSAQDLTNYVSQTVPLLYEGEYGKGTNRVPMQEEYKYAMQLLSQNKQLTIPKRSNAAIDAWRIQASEFLKSTDYQPERYKDPEIAHLVKSMVEDINSAAAIIKAYLQKKATTATIKKPSLVDPRVHDRIKEIIKAIAAPEIAAAEERDLSAILNEQKAKIEQLPPEYQEALKQYFNINERIQKISPAPEIQPAVPSAPEVKPVEPTKEPEPTGTTPLTPVSIEQPIAQPTEQKPTEPVPSPAPAAAPEQPPAPTEEIKPVGLEKAVEKSAAAPTTTTAAAPTEQPGVPIAGVSPTAGAAPTGTAGEATTTTSLKEALEKQGEIREIAVSTAAKAVAPSPASPASTTTPSRTPSSTPSASAISSPSASAYVPTPEASYSAPTESTTEPTIPTTQSTVSTTAPVVETPATSSTFAAPIQSQPQVNMPSAQAVQQSGKAVQDSLKELRDQLRQIDTRTT